MIKYLIEKEIKHFIRDSFLLKAALIIPVMVILVLPLVVTMDIKNIKVCIQDNDNSSASRRLVSLIDASNYFLLTDNVHSYDEALSKIEYGKADVVLTISSGFEKELLSGVGVDALISANATDATKGSLGGAYMSAIVSEFAVSYLNEATGITSERASISQLNMFNPKMNYRTFMLPALMGMIVIIISCVFPALAIVSEKESGTIEQINVTPVKRWQFILAKLIPYWIIGIVALSITFGLAWLIYDFKPVGSFLTIYVASILMTASMSGLGLLISNASSTFQQAIFLFFFVMIVSILMSGLYTSTTSMPEWAQIFSYIMPPKYFMEIMRGVYLKGSGFIHLWQQFVALIAFAIGFSAAAIATYKKRG